MFCFVDDVDILPVNHMLHSTCWVIMRGNVLWLKNTHFPRSDSVYWLVWVQDLWGFTSRYQQLHGQTEHARLHIKKKKNNLKRVVKLLTSFEATHTQRHDTSPLAVYRLCASSTPYTSCDCFTTWRGLFGQKRVHKHTVFILSRTPTNTLCVVCVGMSSVIDRVTALVVDEVIQQRDHCVALFFAFVLIWHSEEGQ